MKKHIFLLPIFGSVNMQNAVINLKVGKTAYISDSSVLQGSRDLYLDLNADFQEEETTTYNLRIERVGKGTTQSDFNLYLEEYHLLAIGQPIDEITCRQEKRRYVVFSDYPVSYTSDEEVLTNALGGEGALENYYEELRKNETLNFDKISNEMLEKLKEFVIEKEEHELAVIIRDGLKKKNANAH